MAYNLYSGATIEAYGPMLYDILALQYIYGANMTTRAGDDVYTFQTDKEYLECIWDAGGHDTIDLSNQTRNQVIDLRAGTFSSIGVKNNGHDSATAMSRSPSTSTIEDAIGGSGHDKIIGNDVANDLDGNIGNDTIVGGAGNDTLTGGDRRRFDERRRRRRSLLRRQHADKVIELARRGDRHGRSRQSATASPPRRMSSISSWSAPATSMAPATPSTTRSSATTATTSWTAAAAPTC